MMWTKYKTTLNEHNYAETLLSLCVLDKDTQMTPVLEAI